MNNQREKRLLPPGLVRPALWLMFGITLLTIAMSFSGQKANAADLVVYKSPNCGCCGKWVEHLEKNGFSVEVRNRQDLHGIKSEMGVPHNLRSCHTAVVDGYVIEGHVPADVITRLLKEKPSIKGLAVPGMPMGSPGMEGPRKDPYQVVTFQRDGESTIYSSENQ